MLTRDRYLKIAEEAAAAEFGARHYKGFMFRRFLAGPAGALTLVIGGVVGLYFLATHLHLPSASGHLSPIFWGLVVGLALGTAWSFRPGRMVPVATTLVKAFLFGLIWLGLAIYALVVLI